MECSPIPYNDTRMRCYQYSNCILHNYTAPSFGLSDTSHEKLPGIIAIILFYFKAKNPFFVNLVLKIRLFRTRFKFSKTHCLFYSSLHPDCAVYTVYTIYIHKSTLDLKVLLSNTDKINFEL